MNNEWVNKVVWGLEKLALVVIIFFMSIALERGITGKFNFNDLNIHYFFLMLGMFSLLFYDLFEFLKNKEENKTNKIIFLMVGMVSVPFYNLFKYLKNKEKNKRKEITLDLCLIPIGLFFYFPALNIYNYQIPFVYSLFLRYQIPSIIIEYDFRYFIFYGISSICFLIESLPTCYKVGTEFRYWIKEILKGQDKTHEKLNEIKENEDITHEKLDEMDKKLDLINNTFNNYVFLQSLFDPNSLKNIKIPEELNDSVCLLVKDVNKRLLELEKEGFERAEISKFFFKNNKIRDFFALGNFLSIHKKYDFAIKYFETSIEVNPEDYKAWNNMGLVYFKKQEFDEALECCKKAIQINPEEKFAWNNMGLVYFKKQEFDEAIECFKKVIQINPKDSGTWYNMGMAYAEKEEFDKAIECFKKETQTYPEDSEAWTDMGLSYVEKEEFNKAIECCKKAIQIDPKNKHTWYIMGAAYAKKNELDQAIECFKKATQIDPKYYDAWYSLGMLYIRSDEFTKAKECLEKTKF